MTDRTSHWDSIYSTRDTREVSWYQPRPETSLRLIDRLGIDKSDAVIDVGGGASSLVDHLVEQAFEAVTVMDISTSALQAVKERLGAKAARVQWLAGDITRQGPPGPFGLWHDRAVFHFLVEPVDRARYVDALTAALPPGGAAIVATFAENGPERCSNLPVRRYDPDTLAAELGTAFEMTEALRETHVTPAQGRQNFIYCCFRRR